MARRTFESHGGFFTEFLRRGLRVLDCGCGPGSITQGIAARVFPGEVVGVDFNAAQLERAARDAAAQGVKNVRFISSGVDALPFANATFDRVFCHALLEHLTDSQKAIDEFYRILVPGGVVGVCSPDWGGYVLAPPSAALNHAIKTYATLLRRNGGDVNAGRKLGDRLADGGFRMIAMGARYECYSSLPLIGEYLALQLTAAGSANEAETIRNWSKSDRGLFAQTWVWATGVK